MPSRSLPPPRRCLAALAGAVAVLLLLGVRAFPWPDEPVSRPQRRGVRPVPLPDPFAGLYRIRQLRRLGVDRWHEAGLRGRGLKVAVLDSGFRGYRSHLGRSLPARVTVRSFRRDGNLEAPGSEHGILCAEAVHAIAPEADILLANWEPNYPGRFLEAVRWTVGAGARVLTCSVIMPTWSDGEGGGPIHPELARVLDASVRSGVLFFACAGNTADRHWSGPFEDAGGGWHAWQGGQTDNPLTPWGKGRVSVELCVESDADLELSVYDATARREVERCPVRQGFHRCAVVRLRPVFGHSYRVRVRSTGTRTGHFHVFVLGGGLGCARANGSIAFPGDGPEVVTVGAVDADGFRAAYSSCGPNSAQPKPDLVATVPFVSLFRLKPFTGTSAAAPQAAGLAALLWGHHPGWNARQVRQALREAAVDLGPPGHDWETGHGLIHLPPPPPK